MSSRACRVVRRLMIVATIGVSVPSGSIRAQASARWTAVRDLSVDAASEPARLIGAVAGLVVARNGSIIVGESRSRRVLVFDSDGSLQLSWGGPGSLEGLSAIGWLGDTLWVSDGSAKRLVLASPEGRRLATFDLRVPATRGPFVAGTPRGMLVGGNVVGQPGPTPDALRDPNTTVPVLLLDRAGRLVDTLAALSLGHPITSTRGGGIFLYSPFNDGGLWAVQPDGRAVTFVVRAPATSLGIATFRVGRRGPKGERIFDIEVPYAPIPMSSAIRDSAVAEGTRRFKDERFAETDIAVMIARGMYTPAFLPPVSGLVAGSDGTTWIERERVRAGTSTWQVLDLRGRLTAQVELPSIFRLLYANDQFLWGTERADDDRLILVRYRIAR